MQVVVLCPRVARSLAFLLLLAAPAVAGALPAGFEDHGVAAPVARQPFGQNTFATVNQEGRRVVFSKIWTGGETSYLFIDAETGASRQIGPGIGGRGGWPVVMSPENKVYDTLDEWFVEIDLSTGEFRRIGRIPSGMALSYAIGVDGVVYAGIYPSATLVSYNPATGEYRDRGALTEESWPQYPRPMAVDEEGWVYVGIGQNLGQVVAHNPGTGETRKFISEEKRVRGQGDVFLGADGKVYGRAPGWDWHVLLAGEATPVESPAVRAPSPRPAEFTDGSRFTRVDFPNRSMHILDAGEEHPRKVTFAYESGGARIYCLIAGPDGNIYGGTGIPLRIWRFDPVTEAMDDWGLAGHAGHVNEFVVQGDKLYGSVYSSGSLIEYDPAKPFHDTGIRESRNPRHLHGYRFGHGGSPDMFGRPYAMLAHPDGRHVIMGGNPARVLAGGGFLIYDTGTGEETALKPDELVRDQGVMAIGALPNGDLIVGSTTVAATGGTSSADVAQVYRLDWETRAVTDRWTPRPAVRTIRDLLVGEDGLIYIKASQTRFLILDPERGEFIFDETIANYGPLTGGQAPRTMAWGPDGYLYLLFRDAIARFDTRTRSHREVARPGFHIHAGIAIHENRLYFTHEGRLYSYDLSREINPDSRSPN